MSDKLGFATSRQLLWRANGPLPVGFLVFGLIAAWQTRDLWDGIGSFTLESHWMLLLPVLMIGGALVALFRGWREARSMARAAQGGRRLRAHIQSIKETTSSRNKRRLWEMRWTDERGESGRARPDYKSRFETLSPGDEISVFRDPQSDRVFWERDLPS